MDGLARLLLLAAPVDNPYRKNREAIKRSRHRLADIKTEALPQVSSELNKIYKEYHLLKEPFTSFIADVNLATIDVIPDSIDQFLGVFHRLDMLERLLAAVLSRMESSQTHTS